MQDPADIELQKAEPTVALGTPRPRSAAPWVAVVLVLIAIATGAYVYLQRGETDAAPEAAEPPPEAPPVSQPPLGAAADLVDIPPLDVSDEIVRMLVTALSSHARVAAWLATDDLIRNFTVVVENISNGSTPAAHLRMLRPIGPFRVVERGNRLMVDPRSYDRYSGLADAVASVDPEGAARLYSNLKPRIEEAYRELGREEPFDRALERAIVSLLRVPVLEGDVELEPQGIVYQFTDARVEEMTSAQKQLARMGPRNVRTIQARLRAIALALGIPPARLPA